MKTIQKQFKLDGLIRNRKPPGKHRRALGQLLVLLNITESRARLARQRQQLNTIITHHRELEYARAIQDIELLERFG